MQSLLKLQYLDLSYNGLSDENCSAILLASLQGGIEGVELGLRAHYNTHY